MELYLYIYSVHCMFLNKFKPFILLKMQNQLANITSSVKLPTSFDGLVNKIIKKNPKNKERNLDYDKTWFQLNIQ